MQEREQGYIKGSVNLPQSVLVGADADVAITSASALQGAKEVVVHCHLCQKRGPLCSRILAEKLSALGKDTAVTFLTGGVSTFMASNAGDATLVELPQGSWTGDANH